MKTITDYISLNEKLPHKDDNINEAEAGDSNPIVIELKNALMEELNAWYGYIMVREFLVGQQRHEIAEFYEETAKDELEDHGYWLMKRIAQMGGTIEDITLSPSTWENAKHKYIEPIWKSGGIPVEDSLQTNIENEEGAIQTYMKIIEMTETIDPTTNAKAKEILADEEEHLQELKDFLNDIK